MQTLSEIKALLAQHGLTPRKRFGQNFLHDQNQLRRLVSAAGVAPRDVVLEIGPGTGTLTEALLEIGAIVVACEIDRDLAAMLRERLGDRITLVEGDVLAKGRAIAPDVLNALAETGAMSFTLVANLPYQVASPLLATLLLRHGPEPKRAESINVHAGNAGGPRLTCAGQYITIQREVADRLVAAPGTKQYGSLSVIVQTFARVDRIATLSPSCFWPAPEVTSAMVTIAPDDRHPMSVEDREAFAAFVTQLFTRRRKQLGAILGRDLPAEIWPADVTPDQRPETLTAVQFVTLWRNLREG